ncbi:MAG TPA: hypothetical protein ENF48_07110 [Desulfobacteraceae bacterium]|nr:hypothetical protein [Deltaproteobacteria bacterium]MBW2355978.1 hypothetical protein [Deltaproteobacteria bacterium]HDI60103.1 hypothetical protein [Desulfobacteraceae bacterium]
MPMKLSDLFVPKIARSDPKVRKKAVAQESNPVVLKKVVENDSDPGVRQAAQQRLEEIQAQG